MVEATRMAISEQERAAYSLLNESCCADDYARNLGEVFALGIDPRLLDPEYLDRAQDWKRVEAHQNIIQTGRMIYGMPFSEQYKNDFKSSGDIEPWTEEETAEFILNNSLFEEEYRRNLQDVIEMGVDPLSLNPDFLDRGEFWKRAEAHEDLLQVKSQP